MGRPKKRKFPIELDAMLLSILPKERKENRMKILRECLRSELTAPSKPGPTEPELDEKIQLIRERKFDDVNQIFRFSEALKDFVPVFKRENRSKKAQHAADVKWSKENREKRAKKIKKKLT